MDWGSSLAGPYSQMKEEEPPSFALSSDSDSEDSDESGLVMKKVIVRMSFSRIIVQD